jgi:hypothetical protein
MREFKLWVLTFFTVGWHLASGFLPSKTKGAKYYRATRFALNESPGSLVGVQRERCEDILTGIVRMQSELELANSTEELQSMNNEINSLESLTKKVLSQPLPPMDLSSEEYINAISAFLKLPPIMRLMFVKALELEDSKARDPYAIPEIVSKLYEERARLTPKRLTDAMKLVKSASFESTGVEATKSQDAEGNLNKFFEQDPDKLRLDETMKNFLGRVTRKEDTPVTPKDLEILTQALDDKSVFIPSSPAVEIPGGYLIAGENRKSSGGELIEGLDAKLPKNWDCTVSYMVDLSKLDSEFDEEGNALVLLKNDFSLSTSPWFYRIATVSALATTLLFSVGVYGSNEAVLNQLTDGSIGDFNVLDWFNGKVTDILVPLAVILASHEIGHLLVSKKENIDTELPSFMPTLNSLPLFGTVTRIKSSPRNLTALFDFAFMGPLFGFVSSFVFLGVGLMATKSAFEGDSNAAQYLPALPVSVLKLSTLGSSVVDNFFGGDGQITAQSPNTPVPLHPFAIAGFCGLLINAAEMLPLGANDGGRLSLAVFGRQGHTAIGGFTWIALLFASFSFSENQGDWLVTAWAINNIVQNDQEVPCRDETENIDIPRSFAVFAMWFLAILVVVPV